MYYSDYGYMEDTILGVLGIVSLVMVLAAVWGIVSYVLRSVGLYTMAKRRSIRGPWTAWVPVANYWLRGCISDHYQSVVKGKRKYRRRVLLTLRILVAVGRLAMVAVYIAGAAGLLQMAFEGVDYRFMQADAADFMMRVWGVSAAVSVIGLVLAVLGYIALFDIYRACSRYSVLFLVLSIVFPVTEPFFLFCNRKSDAGLRVDRFRPLNVPPREEPEGF